jgi:hypothetical protein
MGVCWKSRELLEEGKRGELKAVLSMMGFVSEDIVFLMILGENLL